MKIFDWDGRKGTLIDSVSKTVGLNTNCSFVKSEKGLAIKNNSASGSIVNWGDLSSWDLGTGDFTIVSAFKFRERTGVAAHIFGKRGGEASWLRHYINAYDVIYLEIGGGGNFLNGPTLIVGQVYLVIGSRKDGDLFLYINNIDSGNTGTNTSTIDNTGNVSIADWSGNYSDLNTYYGRLYNTALTQQERNDLYKEFLNSYGTTEQKRNFTYPKPTDLSSEVDRGSDLIAPLDFNNWTLSSGTVVTNDSFTGATSLYKSITTIGKKYNYNVVGTTTDSNLKFYDGFTGATLIKDLGTGSFSATGTFTSQASSGIPTAIQFDLADANSTTTITNFTITELTGLVAAYNFIPSKGKLIDISGQGNDGTISGALSTKDGMKFDGVDDYVDLDAHTASVASLSEGSIVTRFKYANTTDNQTLFSSSDKSDSSSDINIKTDPAAHRLIFVIRENAGFVLDADLPSDYADGLWHTYIVAVNSSGNKHYVDGMQVTPDYSTGDASTQGFFSDVNDLDTLRIGNREDSGGNEYYWDGDVGELKIYSYALTAQQAKAYHNSFIKPVLIETFKDSGADGIVKTPRGWIDGTGSYSITEVDYDI